MNRIAPDQPVYCYGDGHWISEGKTLLGVLVAERVEDAHHVEKPEYRENQ